MKNTQMSVKERLITFLKSQGISQRVFERSIDVSNGYVNNIRVSIQPDKLQRIAQQYPMLNMAWLISEDGGMLKDDIRTVLGDVAMPREVFEKMSRLIDTVCSQQDTISEQCRMIDRLILGQNRALDAPGVENADSADVG